MSHATLSPSSAARWMRCPGSVQACASIPDESSEHADEGTAAHELAARCLTSGTPAVVHVGSVIPVGTRTFTVDAEMASFVQVYLDHVADFVHPTVGGQLFIEQRVPIGAYTGELGALGTADAVVLLPQDGELAVIDLKFGRGVEVKAEDNEQLQLYALGALDLHDPEGLVHGIERVRLVIVQPRVQAGISESVLTRDALADFAEQVREAAEFTRHPDAPRIASPKACQWCRAKATCPALAEKVQEEIGAEFENLTTFNREMTEAHMSGRPAGLDAERLALAMAAVDLVEGWCKAVRAETERRLLAGDRLPGWKLVQGKRGARQWTDADQAEQALKAMRLKVDEMYDLKLISPTTAEKLAKAGAIGPRQWPRLQPLITQSEGRPSVAPESDKRPALDLRAASDDFDDASVVATPAAEAALS